MLSTLILVTVVLSGVDIARADICYDRFGRAYNCYGGLSYGARIGIGLGIAAAVLLLFSLCAYNRRRQLRNQFSKYRPPTLPYSSENNAPNPYVNNPPPPQGNWENNQYGNNPPPPPSTYQPSMAGQYGGMSQNPTGTIGKPERGADDHEHGYEWAQAREAERLEREQGNVAGGDLPPPGYEVTSNNTGGYAPPPGPPPKKTTEGTV